MRYKEMVRELPELRGAGGRHPGPLVIAIAAAFFLLGLLLRRRT